MPHFQALVAFVDSYLLKIESPIIEIQVQERVAEFEADQMPPQNRQLIRHCTICNVEVGRLWQWKV